MDDRRRTEHTSLTPAQRSERAQKAARARWDNNRYDRYAATQPARDAFWQRFVDEVDPDRQLEPYVRERRAHEAQRRYFQDIARRRRER